MTANVYIESEGYIALKSEQTFLKFLVPKQLTAIKEIKTYNDGYMVIETNYGEEYIDLKAVADEIELSLNFSNINPILGSV